MIPTDPEKLRLWKYRQRLSKLGEKKGPSPLRGRKKPWMLLLKVRKEIENLGSREQERIYQPVVGRQK